MSPLFSVTTTYTPALYRKMLEFDIRLKFKKQAILFYALGGILCILSLLLYVWEGFSPFFLICVFLFVFCLCYPMLLKKLIVSVAIKNALRTDSVFFSQSFACEFFEEYLEQKSAQSALLLYYSQLYQGYETGEAFYLYQSRQKAIILPKSAFTLGTPEDFTLFLQHTLGEKFKRTVS